MEDLKMEEKVPTWSERHYFGFSIVGRSALIVLTGMLTVIAFMAAISLLVSMKVLPNDWIAWVILSFFSAVLILGYFLIGWMFAFLLVDLRRDLRIGHYIKKIQHSITNLEQSGLGTSELTYNMDQLNLLLLSHYLP